MFQPDNLICRYNPKNAIFYLTLMTVIIGESATLAQQTFVGIWMTFLVFFWDVCLAAVISHRKAQEVLAQRIHCIELAAGGVLIIFAGVVTVNFVLP